MHSESPKPDDVTPPPSVTSSSPPASTPSASPPGSPYTAVGLESLPDAAILSRDDILNIKGHERVLLLAMCNGRWVPLEPDRRKKRHRLSGIHSSGFVVRPAERLSVACSFRLEVPTKGDMTRVFMRSARSEPELDADSPKYRDCPYLLFVGEVLCVRHLPAHAIASNKRARSE